jgi:hypothetical protein
MISGFPRPPIPFEEKRKTLEYGKIYRLLPSEAKGANPQRHVCRQEKRNIFVSVGCKRTIQLSPLKGNTAFL